MFTFERIWLAYTFFIRTKIVKTVAETKKVVELAMLIRVISPF